MISAYYEVAANLFQVRRVYLDWAAAYDDARSAVLGQCAGEGWGCGHAMRGYSVDGRTLSVVVSLVGKNAKRTLFRFVITITLP